MFLQEQPKHSHRPCRQAVLKDRAPQASVHPCETSERKIAEDKKKLTIAASTAGVRGCCVRKEKRRELCDKRAAWWLGKIALVVFSVKCTSCVPTYQHHLLTQNKNDEQGARRGGEGVGGYSFRALP